MSHQVFKKMKTSQKDIQIWNPLISGLNVKQTANLDLF